MVCPNCSANFNDDMMYCPNCGMPVNGNNGYREQHFSQQSEPYTMPNYGMPNFQQPELSKPVSIGQYLRWMILGTVFGPISLIISIVFACMGENKNRANFFRAMLIVWAIVVVIAIIAIIAVAVLGFSILGSAEPSAFSTYEYYDEFLRIASQIVF